MIYDTEIYIMQANDLLVATSFADVSESMSVVHAPELSLGLYSA